MMAVDITSANVYRYYSRDIQAGTIIHDEVDEGEIDKDASLCSIYTILDIETALASLVSEEKITTNNHTILVMALSGLAAQNCHTAKRSAAAA
jgi:hypothetical protein